MKLLLSDDPIHSICLYNFVSWYTFLLFNLYFSSLSYESCRDQFFVVNPWRVWVKLRKISLKSSAFLHPQRTRFLESHGVLFIKYNNTEFSLVVCRWSSQPPLRTDFLLYDAIFKSFFLLFPVLYLTHSGVARSDTPKIILFCLRENALRWVFLDFFSSLLLWWWKNPFEILMISM